MWYLGAMNIKRERERSRRLDIAIHKGAIRAEAKALKVWEKSKEDYLRQISYLGTRRHNEEKLVSRAEDENWAKIHHLAAIDWTCFCAKQQETTNAGNTLYPSGT